MDTWADNEVEALLDTSSDETTKVQLQECTEIMPSSTRLMAAAMLLICHMHKCDKRIHCKLQYMNGLFPGFICCFKFSHTLPDNTI